MEFAKGISFPACFNESLGHASLFACTRICDNACICVWVSDHLTRTIRLQAIQELVRFPINSPAARRLRQDMLVELFWV